MQRKIGVIKNFFLIFLFIFSANISYCESLFLKKIKKISLNDEVAVKNVKYVEKKESYDNFLTPERIKLLRQCYKKNRKWLNKAKILYNVNPKIISAILMVESLCGKYHEKYNVVSVYVTLKKLGEDKYYREKILKAIQKRYPQTTYRYFLKRVRKKYIWAKKQLKVLKIIYDFHKIDVFKIKGSWAGAFGLPQFIPTTFLHYAVDGNDDGKIDLNHFPDAILSIANYLKRNGWRDNFSREKKFKVILKYNYSKLYAKTILMLAGKI